MGVVIPNKTLYKLCTLAWCGINVVWCAEHVCFWFGGSKSKYRALMDKVLCVVAEVWFAAIFADCRLDRKWLLQDPTGHHLSSVVTTSQLLFSVKCLYCQYLVVPVTFD